MKMFLVLGFTVGALTLAGCSGGGAGTDTPPPAAGAKPTPPAGAVVLSAREFVFAPATLTLHVGKPVTLFVENDGSADHDLKSAIPISGLVYDHSDNDPDEQVKNAHDGSLDLDFKVGHSAQVSFTPTTAGTFPFGCSHTGHAEKGMVGSFVVTP